MDRQKKIVKTSILGIVVNVLLVIFKAMIGVLVNSIAIILDAVNNLTDAISSIVTIIGTKLAHKKPDKEHPFGHGRIEYFTSVVVSFIVLLAGAGALKESVEKIINPGELDYSLISLFVISVAVLVKFFFGKYVKKIGREVNSQSLVASGEDAFMDSILSLTTLVSGILNYVWKLNIEGYLGVLISFVILKSATDMLRETLNIMIGERADKEITDKLKKIISSHSEVKGTYDLAIHNYVPSKVIATAHIQVRDDMTAQEIHILTRRITLEIYNKLGIVSTIGIYASNDEGKFGDIKRHINRLFY